MSYSSAVEAASENDWLLEMQHVNSNRSPLKVILQWPLPLGQALQRSSLKWRILFFFFFQWSLLTVQILQWPLLGRPSRDRRSNDGSSSDRSSRCRSSSDHPQQDGSSRDRRANDGSSSDRSSRCRSSKKWMCVISLLSMIKLGYDSAATTYWMMKKCSGWDC